jgi:hypothetical protein
MCVFSIISRVGLRPNKPPIQWVLGVISPRMKWQMRESDHSSPSGPEYNNVGAILPLSRMSLCSDA